jgi:hypothetical protein
MELRTAGSNRKAKTVDIEMTARGSGSHDFSLKAFNGRTSEPAKKISLDQSKAETIRWTVQVDRADSPWVAVVMADGDRTPSGELHGCLQE